MRRRGGGAPRAGSPRSPDRRTCAGSRRAPLRRVPSGYCPTTRHPSASRTETVPSSSTRPRARCRPAPRAGSPAGCRRMWLGGAAGFAGQRSWRTASVSGGHGRRRCRLRVLGGGRLRLRCGLASGAAGVGLGGSSAPPRRVLGAPASASASAVPASASAAVLGGVGHGDVGLGRFGRARLDCRRPRRALLLSGTTPTIRCRSGLLRSLGVAASLGAPPRPILRRRAVRVSATPARPRPSAVSAARSGLRVGIRGELSGRGSRGRTGEWTLLRQSRDAPHRGSRRLWGVGRLPA